MIVTVDEMKNYLRIDFEDDDSLLENFITAGVKQCMDILRTDDENDLSDCPNGKIAVMFTVAYLYEHREEADHHAMDLTLRALLFGSRKPEGGILMDVAALRSKVTFQKNETVTDKYGNHKNAWTDYYTCFATIGGEGLASSKEEQTAGTTVEDFSMTVSVRYCQKVAAIDSTHFRVMFMGEIYNIVNIDHMNFRKKSLKFTCRKERR